MKSLKWWEKPPPLLLHTLLLDSKSFTGALLQKMASLICKKLKSYWSVLILIKNSYNCLYYFYYYYCFSFQGWLLYIIIMLLTPAPTLHSPLWRLIVEFQYFVPPSQSISKQATGFDWIWELVENWQRRAMGKVRLFERSNWKDRLNAFVRLAIKRLAEFCVAQECVSKHELKLEVTKLFYWLITFFDRDVHIHD
jgi:hypothetical protein